MMARSKSWQSLRGRREIKPGVNQWFDSMQEANYARYLQHLEGEGRIRGWLKNQTRFPFSKPVEVPGGRQVASYVPDFFVFTRDGGMRVVEVKGWMNDKARLQLEQFRRDYPMIDVGFVDRKKVLEIEAQHGHLLPGWEWMSVAAMRKAGVAA